MINQEISARKKTPALQRRNRAVNVSITLKANTYYIPCSMVLVSSAHDKLPPSIHSFSHSDCAPTTFFRYYFCKDLCISQSFSLKCGLMGIISVRPLLSIFLYIMYSPFHLFYLKNTSNAGRNIHTSPGAFLFRCCLFIFLPFRCCF